MMEEFNREVDYFNVLRPMNIKMTITKEPGSDCVEISGLTGNPVSDLCIAVVTLDGIANRMMPMFKTREDGILAITTAVAAVLREYIEEKP